MSSAREATKAEMRALEVVVDQGFTGGDGDLSETERKNMTMSVIEESRVAVIDDCNIPSVEDPYNGKVLVFLPLGNPLLTEVYLWREGVWEEVALHAAEE